MLLQVAGLLAVVMSGGAIGPWVSFDSGEALSGKVWTVATYAFFEWPSIWFVLGAYFFFRFGSMVEHSMGRRDYVILCISVLLLPPVLLILAHLARIGPGGLAGSGIPHFSIFMAFCAMFPNVPSFFGIRIKWFGLAFFAVTVLQFLAIGGWAMIIAYAATVLVAIWYVRRLGYREGFNLKEELLGPGASMPRIGRKQKKQRVRRAREIKPKLKPKSDLLKQESTEVDRILDKINKEGLHSLSDEERALLQRKAGN